MMFFTQLAFLDVFELACSLRPRLSLFSEADAGGRRVMNIRWRDGEKWLRLKEAAKWPELANTLARIEQIGTAIVGPVERGEVFFEMLDPGAALPWHEYIGPHSDEYWRLHLAIRTNPGCMMYAGVEAVNLLPGQIVRVATSVMSSAVNMGEWPRVHLVADWRRAAKEKDN